jgi:replicative DNA helicase
VNGRDLVPPHDLDAERALIGACLVSEQALGVVSNVVTHADFYAETHREIFASALSLSARGEPVDQLTVAEELERRDRTKATGGREYLIAIMDAVPTAANARGYAKTVREKAILRDLMDVGATIQHDAYSSGASAEEALDAAEQAVYSVGDRRRRGPLRGSGSVSMEELIPRVVQGIQERYESGGEGYGLRCGYRDVDDLLGGFGRGDLIILAGRPAMGKTSWALGTVLHAAGKLGVGVALVSLEMSEEQVGQRMVSMASELPLEALRRGEVLQGEWPKLVRHAAELNRLPVEINDEPIANMGAARGRVRRMASRLRARGAPLGLVVVDYLQLMKGTGRENRQQDVAEISRGLKVMARDLDVPVLALSQLNRGVEQRDDKRPFLSDLRDSGGIEADADAVIFLYRDEYYDPESEEKGIAEVIVAKHRNGPTGTRKLAWIGRLAAFRDLAPGRVPAGRGVA